MTDESFLTDRFIYVYEGNLEFLDASQAIDNFDQELASILPSNIIEARNIYKEHYTISYDYDIVEKRLIGIRTWENRSLKLEYAELVSPYATKIPNWRKIY
jgi:hypothetical protein